MAIPSRQIGWSTQSNLLWQISKQLQELYKNIVVPTTTTTSTTLAPLPFYGTIYWGATDTIACSLSGTINAAGSSFTFCDSVYYYLGYFPVPSGDIFISDGLGNVKKVFYDGGGLMTSISECTACI